MLNKKLLTAAVTTALFSGAGLAQAQERDDLDTSPQATALRSAATLP